MKKDAILKNITKEVVLDILKYIIKIDARDVEFLDIEFEKIEVKKADILIKADEKIIHIEFQSSNDYKMPIRMARYFLDIYSRYKDYEILQYVIFTGKKLYMDNKIDLKNFKYNFEIIDTKTLPCDKFLKLNDPRGVVLSILCNVDKNDIKNILLRLYQLSKTKEEFKKYLLMIEELSLNKDIKDIIKEEEMRLSDIKLEDLPSYEIGLEKGMQKGKNEAIKEIANKLIIKFNDEKKVAEMLDLDEDYLRKLLK